MQDGAQDTPVGGDEFLRRLFTSVRELDASPGNPELGARVKHGISLLDEIGARGDGIGLEARKVSSDLGSFFDWRAGGSQGDAPAPFQGVAYKKGGLLGFGGETKFVEDVTSKPAFLGVGGAPDGQYLVSPEFSSYVLESGRPEATRRARLIGHPSQRGQIVRDEGGDFLVDFADGRHEQIPIQQVVKDWPAIRNAMQGEAPNIGGPVGDVTGRMPTLNAAGEWVSRQVASAISGLPMEELPPLVNVPTADPAFPFPALPDFGDGHQAANARLQDPRYLRAVQEVMGIVQAGKSMELLGADLERPEDQTTWEAAAGALGFVTDFWAAGEIAKAPLAVAGAGARALASTSGNPVMRVLASAPLKSANAVLNPPGGKLAGAIAPGLKSIGQFSAYETLRAGLMGDDDIGSAAMEGAKQGLLLTAASQGVSMARKAFMRQLAHKGIDGTFRWGAAGRKMSEFVDATRLGKVGSSADAMTEAAAKLAGTGTLRDIIKGIEGTGFRNESIVQAVDSMALGALFGAHGDAMADPEWDNMTGAQKTARIVEGLASQEAWGSALGFGLSSAAHAGAHKYSLGKEWSGASEKAKAAVESKLRDIAEQIASPASHQPVEDFRRAFEQMKATDPELFKELEFVTQAERDARIELLREMELEEGDIHGPLQSPEEPPPGESGGPSAQNPPHPAGPGGPSAQESAKSAPTEIPTAQSIGDAIRAKLAEIEGAPRSPAGARQPKPEPEPETEAGQVFHVERSGLSKEDRARLASGQPLEVLRGVEGGAEMERVKVPELTLSPEEFQYKGHTDPASGMDPEGPLAKLKKRSEFSDVSAGPILAYRRANGELAVVDGHQRTNAAKRLGVEELNAYVVNEADGVTPEMARSLGAVINMRNERGRPVDAAQVIRDLGLSRQDLRALGLNPGNNFARKAEGVAELADPVFSMVLNETLPDGYAAAIGKHIPRADQERQLKAAELIRRSATSEDMAESIARQVAATDLVGASQGSLFGETGDVMTMIELRAKLEKPLIAELKRNKGFFARLANLAGLAETAGETKVDKGASAEKSKTAEAVLEAVKQFADRKGTVVNEILNEAASRLGPPHSADPAKLAKWAVDEFARLDWSKPETLEIARPSGAEPPLAQPGQDVLFQTFGTQTPGFEQHAGGIPPFAGAAGGSQGALSYPPGRSLRGRYRAEVKRLLIQRFDLGGKPEDAARRAEVVLALADSHARRWAEETGRKAAEWYPQFIGDIRSTADIKDIGGLALPQSGAGQVKGATEFLRGGQAIIHAIDGADVSTVLHELAHVWRRSGEWATGLPEIAEWAGAKKGFWNTASEEKFARAVERYLHNGWDEHLPKRLKPIFTQIASYMAEVYGRIKGSAIDVKIPEEVREKLDQLFMGKGELPEAEVVRTLAEYTPEQLGAIYDQNRNKPEYLGMDPMEIAGHELRRDLEPKVVTPATKVAQSADNYSKAVEILRSVDAIDIPGIIVTPESARRVVELANGGTPELEALFSARGKLDAYAAAIEAARQSRAQMRVGLSELADKHAGPEHAKRISSLFDFLDGKNQKQALADLREAGAMDGDSLRPGVLQSLEVLFQELRNKARSVATSNEHAIMDNASPWVAFDRAPNEFRESYLSKHVKLKRLMDVAQHRIPPSMLKQMKRLGSYMGGPWGGVNFLKSIEALSNRLAVEQVFSPHESQARQAQVMGQAILGRMMARWGWQHPPRSHLMMMDKAIESGAFKSMSGPEDFERIQKGTGYLFDAAKDHVDLMTEMGHGLRLSGWLSEAQFRKWVGRYVAHFYHREDVDGTIAELREGRMPASFAGRNRGRDAKGENESEVRIRDPFWYIPREVAQESKTREWFGLLSGLLHGGHAVGEDTIRALTPQDQTFYLPAVATMKHGQKGGEQAYGLRLRHILTEQLSQSAAASGKFGVNEPMRNLMESFLLGRAREDGTREPLYLTRQSVQELDAVAGQLFNPPALDTPIQKLVYAYDVATRFVRRGLTIGRPKHWTLNITNSVMTNALMDAASLTDFAKSVLTGKGNYADSARDLIAYQEVTGTKGRLPDARPSGMTLEKWDRLKLLDGVINRLSSGTFLQAGLEGQTVSDLMTSIAEPDNLARNGVREIQESGKPLDDQQALIGAVHNLAGRMGTGLGQVDRMVGEWAGGEPAERARAIAAHVGVYQTIEMFFKHAAVLSTIERQPGLSLDQVIAFAAGGTADYRNTSSALRAYNTAYGTYHNPLWQKTETWAGRAQRAVARDLLKGRFWMYQSNMLLPKLRATVVNPLAAAGIAAVMSGIARQVYKGMVDDPEEAASWQEAHSNAMYTSGSKPELLDDATLEAYRRSGGPGWWPDVSGGARHNGWRGTAAKLWNRVLGGEPFVFPGPNKRRREAVSSLADLAPGWGDVLGAGQAVGSVFDPTKSQKEKVDEFLGAVSFRTMEMSMGLVNGLVRAAVPRPGESRQDVVLKNFQDAVGYAIPTISPLSLLSKDGQALESTLALDGQPIQDWVKGIRHGSEPPSPEQAAGEFLFSTFWRNQVIRQPDPVGASRDPWGAVLRSVMPDIDPGDGPFWDRYKAASKGVHQQLMQIVGDVYGEWSEKLHHVSTLDGAMSVKLYGENSPMEKFIASQGDPEMREAMTRYWTRFKGTPAWEDALGIFSLAGSRREMRPGMFQAAVSNALKDPSGGQLLNWIWEEVRKPGRLGQENARQLSTVFQYGVRMPEPGGEKFVQWQDVARALSASGYTPVDAPQEWLDAALRTLGIKPEMQGLPALRGSLLNRPTPQRR